MKNFEDRESDMKIMTLPPDVLALVRYSTIPLPIISPPSKSDTTKTAEVRRARRRLFTPIEEMETNLGDTFVQELLLDLANQYKDKWGFDFIEDQPIENHSSNIKYVKVSQKEVPGFYRTSTHCFGESADQQCSSEYEHKYSVQASSSNPVTIPDQDCSEVENMNPLDGETIHNDENITRDFAHPLQTNIEEQVEEMELKATPKTELKKIRKILGTPIKNRKCQQQPSIEKFMIPRRRTTSLFDDDHNKVDPTNSPTKSKKSTNSIDIPSSTASASRASHQKRILRQNKRTSCIS